jgi:hypothetical protein
VNNRKVFENMPLGSLVGNQKVQPEASVCLQLLPAWLKSNYGNKDYFRIAGDSGALGISEACVHPPASHFDLLFVDASDVLLSLQDSGGGMLRLRPL